MRLRVRHTLEFSDDITLCNAHINPRNVHGLRFDKLLGLSAEAPGQSSKKLFS